MITDACWTPPNGSTEVEPGWYQAPNGSLYSDPLALEELKAGQRERSLEQHRTEEAERKRRYPEIIQSLIQDVQDLETQAYLLELLLSGALQVLGEEQEQAEFLDDLLACVLSEYA